MIFIRGGINKFCEDSGDNFIRDVRKQAIKDDEGLCFFNWQRGLVHHPAQNKARMHPGNAGDPGNAV